MLLNVRRYAVVTVNGKLPTVTTLTCGEVEIRPATTGFLWEGGASFVIEACVPYGGTLPTDGDMIVIPGDVYKPLQSAIELFVNMLAVQMRSKRSIASPSLYASVEPVDEAARVWLRAFKHIKREIPQTPLRIWPRVEPRRHLPLLLDRLDGLALLAEALCHEHPTGRLHELMRVFERAFAAGPTRVCTHLLPVFLSPAGYGFTPDEVQVWLNLRDRSVHADRRPDFALESETHPVVNRVEQAAYDVLFNKSTWRDEATSRREVFHPWFAANDPNGASSVLHKGGDINIDFRPFDGFGAYPFFLKNCGLEIPEGWVGPEGGAELGPAQLAGGNFLVREDPQAMTATESESITEPVPTPFQPPQ